MGDIKIKSIRKNIFHITMVSSLFDEVTRSRKRSSPELSSKIIKSCVSLLTSCSDNTKTINTKEKRITRKKQKQTDHNKTSSSRRDMNKKQNKDNSIIKKNKVLRNCSIVRWDEIKTVLPNNNSNSNTSNNASSSLPVEEILDESIHFSIIDSKNKNIDNEKHMNSNISPEQMKRLSLISHKYYSMMSSTSKSNKENKHENINKKNE